MNRYALGAMVRGWIRHYTKIQPRQWKELRDVVVAKCNCSQTTFDYCMRELLQLNEIEHVGKEYRFVEKNYERREINIITR